LDCHDVEEHLAAYGLNALSADEALRVESHLDGCPFCSALVREHVQVAASLAMAADEVPLPGSLKRATLKWAGRHARRSRVFSLPGSYSWQGGSGGHVLGFRDPGRRPGGHRHREPSHVRRDRRPSARQHHPGVAGYPTRGDGRQAGEHVPGAAVHELHDGVARQGDHAPGGRQRPGSTADLLRG
jgi:hypothetical protein